MLETLTIEPLQDKFTAFDWNVIEVDGHNYEQLIEAFESDTAKPKVIIANTIKGKGVSYMENQVAWHYRTPEGDLFDQAMKELGENV